MPVDSELAKRLNLLYTNPTFVFREHDKGGRSKVLVLPRIEDDEFTYWVAGQTKLRDGRNVPSVFVISRGGANLEEFFWMVGGQWHDALHDKEAVQELLGGPQAILYPFDWSYSVQVANDIFHN